MLSPQAGERYFGEGAATLKVLLLAPPRIALTRADVQRRADRLASRHTEDPPVAAPRFPDFPRPRRFGGTMRKAAYIFALPPCTRTCACVFVCVGVRRGDW